MFYSNVGRLIFTYENIHSRLADFLNDNNVEIDEENDILFSDTYEEKAVKYIKKWTDSGFLTNYRNEDGEIYYELSSHSIKVLDWLYSLKREEYIGTESKFKSIIMYPKLLYYILFFGISHIYYQYHHFFKYFL